MRNPCVLIVPALALAACGGGAAQPKDPEPIVVEEKEKPKPPPPPPPVCVRAGDAMSLVGMVEADDTSVRFCVSDGAESNKCYGVSLDDQKYSELDESQTPKGASSVLSENPARIETTSREVKVCVGDSCKTFKPKGMKGDNPIDAVTNAAGTHVAILLGNQEAGKGTIDVYGVAKGKKVTTIKKYAKGDYKCGEARMLGDTVFVSASVCAGPAARGYLYNLKGKKIADVGGKDFGTYGTVPVQITETQWAFLEEAGGTVAVQDVVTGQVVQTIDVWMPMEPTEGGGDGLEEGGEAAAPPPGNPGESAMVRAGENKLVVVSGGPSPGSVALVDLTAGTHSSITSLVCEAEEAPAEESAADEAMEADPDEGGE